VKPDNEMLLFCPEEGRSRFLWNVDRYLQNYTVSARKFAQAVTLLTYIQEVVGSNLGLDTDYSD
jgi:hypothetical protein